jgi:ABC-type branched-subunit amino acid transport system permease subunit/ABC-type branched-subunit amino acid transport system ATPase component
VIDRLGWAALAVAVATVPLLTSNTYYLYLVISIGLLTIVTAGLNVLVGFTGQTSLGHAGLYAFGAYTAALCVTRAGTSEWGAVVVAIAVTSIVGAAVAAAALRVSGPYLAMVTIAFGLIVEGVLIEWGSVTGGPGGIFNIPKPALRTHYWTVMLAAALALWLTGNLRHSAWGRAFLAVKSSEVAAESLGLSSYYVRIVAFTVSAAFAGAAGALFTFLNGYISPDSFTLQTSIVFLLALLFGGLGRIAGPVAGSLALTILPELLTSLLDYRLILYGTLLLVSIYWLPEGVIGALSRGRPSRAVPHPQAPHPQAPHPQAPHPTLSPEGRGKAERNPLPHRGRGPQFEPKGEAMRRGLNSQGALLTVTGVSLSFGGVAALAEVGLTVDRRSIHAVIGPNGAGKTSLLNVLSGFYAPDGGEITLDGRSTVGLPPYALARAGIARTFQTAQVFGGLSAWENVAVGVAGRRLGSILGALAGLPQARRREAAIHARGHALLQALGLEAAAAEPAEALAAGLRRKLEIARRIPVS